ncbi:DNA-binding transcriptional regulator, IclR family [Pelosinus fermentans]|jgi:DNA-binding IclR family transcriptional regulator|uniref:Transcriptional regulator IclR n=1 Tax=Pelosinus fermentans B4 TaxID=1149862 RepID=I9B4S0_9FIRM|nr:MULTISPECIES: IclR family transcriptional regulator [Pelosinus]EIW20142.1 Transcriptional regulator IclR [Pelosinus fermentans B4]OAM93052.1 transcriptional regulator, IclR family [Pelosinus fermentans DSM 17108]SDQ65374.1 DNA-binding transcriptional regulator, IclR family [Pelosinus fermentans]
MHNEEGLLILKINKSASRTIELLNLLAISSKPLTQLEISQSLGMPKSSTYELIYTLLEKGIVEFDNEDLRTFRLSLKIFEMGMTVLDKTDFHKISRPLLEELSFKTGETVFMAVEDKGAIVYVDRVEKNTSITTSAGLGTRRPMNCTGLGKALLATYSMERVKEIWEMRDQKAIYTNYTIREYNDLIDDLQQTRERGYAIDNREIEDEIFCVAAPIYDRTDKAIGAISIASIYLKMDQKKTETFGKMIMETALAISKRLGFRRNQTYEKLIH